MLMKFVGLFALIAVCNAQKQMIHIYYESLCPDSQKFITEQLYPALTGSNNLEKYVELKFIPYGKSNDSTRGGDVLFTCHHGPNECYGNKIQSCAIRHIEVGSYQKEFTRETLILEYINCLMKAGNNFADSVYPGEKCAKQFTEIKWDAISTCANSTDGSKLLQTNGQYTQALQPNLKSVPTITYGQQYDDDFQQMSLTNFRKALCGKINPRPLECSADNSATDKTAAAIVTLAAVALLRLF